MLIFFPKVCDWKITVTIYDFFFPLARCKKEEGAE